MFLGSLNVGLGRREGVLKLGRDRLIRGVGGKLARGSSSCLSSGRLSEIRYKGDTAELSGFIG